MKSDRLIFVIYISVSLLSFLCVVVTTGTAKDILTGLLYIWFCFFVFFVFSHSREMGGFKKFENPIKRKQFYIHGIIIVSCVCVIGVIFSVKFYTGSTPMSIIYNLKSGKSLYMLYQDHFSNNQLAVFSIKKIPAIMANVFIEFVFLYSYLNVIVLETKRKREIILILVSTLAKIYIGVARGTNFEMFEIAFLSLYCFWSKRANSRKRMARILAMLFGGIVCVLLFDHVIAMRGLHGDYVHISQEIYTDNNSYFANSFPTISRLIARLGAYFSFGTFTLSYYFSNFLFENVTNCISGFFPFGNMLIGETLPNAAATPHLKSVCWTPDLYQIIKILGVFGGPIVYAFLGRSYRAVESINNRDVFDEMLKFFIIYELFTMPIGGLVWVSSASRMVCIFSIIVYVRRRVYLGLRL